MAHLLLSFGYALLRETPQHTWYLRKDAPEQIRDDLPLQTKSPAAS
jgi:hypothetical protein